MTHALPRGLAAPLAALLVLPCLPGAAAAPLPPTGLQASPAGPGLVDLSWSPPLGAGPDPLTYVVYANGLAVAVLASPHFQVAEGDPVLYSVAAVQDGAEGPPASILVGHVHLGWPIWPLGPGDLLPRCPPLGVDIYTEYPFAAAELYPECLQGWPPQ